MSADVPESSETASSRTLDLDEFTLHYHDLGAGEPLLMFPAWGPQPGVTAWLSWHRVLPALAARYRCLAIDLPNFGRTGPVVDRLPAYRLAVRSAVALLDALAIPSAHVIGTSTGGSAAVVMAMDHPDRVRSLVAGSCHVPSQGYVTNLLSPFPDETLRLAIAYQAAPDRAGLRRMLESMFADEQLVTDALIEAIEDVRDHAPAHAQAAAQSTFELEERGGRLAQIRTPSLFIYGRDDRMIALEHGLALLSLIPTSELVVLSQTGHWPAYESPHRYASHVLRFLDELASGQI